MTSNITSNEINIDAAIARANSFTSRTTDSREDVQDVYKELQVHEYNCDRVFSWFCPSSATEEEKALAAKKLPQITKAIDQLRKEHNLGTSWTLPALATAGVGLAAAHYTGYLSPVFAKAASYVPAVSMPSISLPSLSLPSLGSVGSAIASGSKTVAAAGLEGLKFGAGTIANATSAVAAKAAATASAVNDIWGVSALIPSATNLAIGTGVVCTALLVLYVAKECLNKPKQD